MAFWASCTGTFEVVAGDWLSSLLHATIWWRVDLPRITHGWVGPPYAAAWSSMEQHATDECCPREYCGAYSVCRGITILPVKPASRRPATACYLPACHPLVSWTARHNSLGCSPIDRSRLCETGLFWSLLFLFLYSQLSSSKPLCHSSFYDGI